MALVFTEREAPFISGVSESGLYTQVHNPGALEDMSRGVLVCPTQFMTTLSRNGQTVLSELALRTGSVVYGYDNPGTGGSREMTDEERRAFHSDTGYELTAHTVWDYVLDNVPDVKGRRLAVVGNSMGAYAAAQIMAVASDHGIAHIETGVLGELAAIVDSKKSVLNGLSRYILESLISKGEFPYEPTSVLEVSRGLEHRLIDRDAAWAYIDAFRRTSSRLAIKRAMQGQPDMCLVTIRGGNSLMSPRKYYENIVPAEYRDRWLDLAYTPSRHNITDNPRVFALMAASFLEDFKPQPEEYAP